MAQPMRVWSNGKIVRQGKKQVWLKDGELVTYDNSWEEINSDEPLTTYDNSWEELSGDDKLEVYGNDEVEIGTVDDYTGGSTKVKATFKDWDGRVLKTQRVESGETPTAPADPTRPADEEYTYEFSGWNPTVGPITEDTEYVAQYTATPIPGPEPTEIYPASLRKFANCSWDGANLNARQNGIDVSHNFSLDFNTADTLYRTIDGVGETITDADVISAYQTYITDLMNGQSNKNITEAQYNHLLDITQPLDTTEYTVSIIFDETYGEIYTVAKVVNGTQQEYMSFYIQYSGTREFVRLFNGDTTTRERDATIETIAQLLNNTAYNSGLLFNEEQYNFLKLYDSSTLYMYYNINSSVDGNNTNYTVKTGYKSGSGYIFETGVTIVDDGTQLINSNMGPTTYYVTGTEYADDLDWILYRVQNWFQSFEDVLRFNQLGFYEYKTRELEQTMFGLIYTKETFEGESYIVTPIDGSTDYTLQIQTRANYESSSVWATKILTAQGVQDFFDYCTNNSINAWQELTQAQYEALKQILDDNSSFPESLVIINSNDTSMGNVDVGSVTVANGTAVSANDNVLTIGNNTITATPETGYRFSSWNNLITEVSENWIITAVFEPESV